MQRGKANGYRLGIVNPLTLVGNEIKSILIERSFPVSKVVLLDSTGDAAGAITEIADEAAVVTPISEMELDGLDLVFFCGPSEGNRQWIDRHRELKFVVVDLSQGNRAEEGTLVVAGMNLDEGEGETALASPHPIAVPIALILHQIATVAPVALCTATVIQPASEFEQNGIEELARQTISVLNVKSVTHEVFDRQLAFNLYPAPERREEVIVAQIRSLVRSRAEIALFITQGTVFHGHTFSLFIRLSGPVEHDRIVQAMKANPALLFAEGDQAFGTVDAAGRDEVLIAEMRPDPLIEGALWVWAVCDNLRRSSALNAVLIAEKALFGTGVN